MLLSDEKAFFAIIVFSSVTALKAEGSYLKKILGVFIHYWPSPPPRSVRRRKNFFRLHSWTNRKDLTG
jgi:hypothetical protein